MGLLPHSYVIERIANEKRHIVRHFVRYGVSSVSMATARSNRHVSLGKMKLRLLGIKGDEEVGAVRGDGINMQVDEAAHLV